MSGTKRWAAGLFIALIFMYNHGGGLAQGETSAKAACVMEMETGRVLFEYNARARLPMASTTKVMTALLAIENGDLSAPVACSANAFGVPGTSIYLAEGETLTLEQMLYGLMLASGNDAAVAIAEHIGGSVPQFVRMMNARAAELGAAGTHFSNPNGLPDDTHVTTAYDLALIAREAMNHPEFREIVSTRRASIPWEGRSYSRILNNKNRLLADYDGATGIKTGYTKAAGRCLVFGAKRDGLELIGVVLNCPDWFQEAERILDMGFAEYEYFTAFAAGESVRVLPVQDGVRETVSIVTRHELGAPVRKGLVPTLEYTLPDELPAGFQLGDEIGEVRLMLDGRTLASSPLIVTEGVPERDYAYEVDRFLELWPLSSATEQRSFAETP